jgi:4-amino-4-deoxy-L-arabinose transferase-like glycosyltransferase
MSGMERNDMLIVVGSLAFALVFKLTVVIYDSIPFNSDEAIVALMARHIINGARPIFFYGQAYMGSLDAWLVAIAFWFFGEQVIVIRVVQSALYLIYLLTLWILARRLFRDPVVSNFAIWVAAVPTVLVTTYTTATLGGYGEVLILGNLILLFGYEVTFGVLRDSKITWFGLGVVGGIAFWTLGIAGVYLFAVALVVIWKFSFKRLRLYFFAVIGFFIGSIPWWYFNLNEAWEALAVLTRTSSVSSVNISALMHAFGFLILGIPTLLGFRFPWTPDYAPLPILFVFLLLYGSLSFFIVLGIRRRLLPIRKGVLVLFGSFILIFLLIFMGTRFGIDATGRYLLPLNLILVLSISLMLSAAWRYNRYLGIGLLILVLMINGFETVRAAGSVDKITTQFDPISRFDNGSDQALIDFLLDQDETRGYTNYWVTYRIAFLSNESIIYSPRLPYSVDLQYIPTDNRYPVYDEIVANSPKVAYITTKNMLLDQEIRRQLKQKGISFSEIRIGDYQIFYNLSDVIRPEVFNFEKQTP